MLSVVRGRQSPDLRTLAMVIFKFYCNHNGKLLESFERGHSMMLLRLWTHSSGTCEDTGY